MSAYLEFRTGVGYVRPHDERVFEFESDDAAFDVRWIGVAREGLIKLRGYSENRESEVPPTVVTESGLCFDRIAVPARGLLDL